MNKCSHPEFKADVKVIPFDDKDNLHMAEIRIRCVVCNEPFQFIGLACGVSLTEPMVSPDRMELRAPIFPGMTPMLRGSSRFEM